jgi:DNA-binding transcriptional ArsR family regulator
METFAALADDTRLRILDALAEREMTAGEIAEMFPVSRPAISRHLRVLREAGLVQARGDAQRRIYRIDPRPLHEIDRWLERYRRLWTSRLDALERHLNAKTKRNRR